MSSTTIEKRLTVPSQRGARGGEGEDPEAAPARRGRRTMIFVLLAVLLAAGVGYWFLLGPGASGSEGAQSEPAAPPAPEPGAVLVVNPINLNLAEGRYLRVGLGLQLTAEAGQVDPSRALDATIALFSGRTVQEVSSEESRELLKAELVEVLDELYEGQVMDVYFTDYVTQ